MNEARAFKLINEAIPRFELALSDLIVLTEAASGPFIVTPLIAALAGAKWVWAITRDSRYGQAVEIREATLSLARRWEVEGQIRVIFAKEAQALREADIVTNLGFVRPIDARMVEALKATAVIPLMWETWEFREDDLDLRACWRKGIPVLGTDESDERLRIFDYVGPLCLKKLFEVGIEVFRSKIAVVGGRSFTSNITRTLSNVGAEVVAVCPYDATKIAHLGARKIGESLRDERVREDLRDCDALIITSYPDPNLIIGEKGHISAQELKQLCPGVVVVQLKGNVDRADLARAGIVCIPEREPAQGYMAWTPAELGPRPVIDLHTAGLKVGEALARARRQGLSRSEAEEKVLRELPLAQDFSQEQKRKYREA